MDRPEFLHETCEWENEVNCIPGLEDRSVLGHGMMAAFPVYLVFCEVKHSAGQEMFLENPSASVQRGVLNVVLWVGGAARPGSKFLFRERSDRRVPPSPL